MEKNKNYTYKFAKLKKNNDKIHIKRQSNNIVGTSIVRVTRSGTPSNFNSGRVHDTVRTKSHGRDAEKKGSECGWFLRSLTTTCGRIEVGYQGGC